MKLTLLLGMLPFEFKRVLCSKTNVFFHKRPSSTPFLSGDTFRSMADHLYDTTEICDVKNIRKGDIVFVSSTLLHRFVLELDAIEAPFILLTHQGDTNIDETFLDVVNHTSIIHWFAQNCMLEHPKVTPLPIGLEDRWRHNNGAMQFYKNKRTTPHNKKIAYAFTLGTNVEKRVACYVALKKVSIAYELGQPLNTSLYQKIIRNYMFVASPPGNGLDCHRTWEAMYNGVVPIVEDNYMHRYFKSLGLPMHLVSDWTELSSLDEEKAEELYRSIIQEAQTETLYFKYWKNRIESKKI